jgi:hypothetical protein
VCPGQAHAGHVWRVLLQQGVRGMQLPQQLSCMACVCAEVPVWGQGSWLAVLSAWARCAVSRRQWSCQDW